MNKQEAYNDEIDLSNIFKTILRGKIKIIIIVIIGIFCAVVFSKNLPTPTIKSTTMIKPLGDSQLNIFDLSNSLDIYLVDSSRLYDNYFDLLEERTALRSAVKKFEIVSRENYKNNEKYEEAVSLASHDIVINYSPSAIVNKDGVSNYSTIILSGKNKGKLFELIKHIKNENNRLTIKNIEQEFENKIYTLRKLDEMSKRKILIRIQNKKDEYDVQMNKALQILNYQIEDLDTKIENSINDYKYQISQKLTHLAEQAALARGLGIARADKGNFYYSNSLTTTSSTFYLMGYEAIEKEIQIIKNRKDIERFVLNEELIKKKRDLQQSKVQQRKEEAKLYLDGILTLKSRLRDIDRNEISFLKAEELFKQNLTEFTDNFESVIFDPYSTKFKAQPVTGFFKILVLAIILGSIIGIFYVIIEEKIKKVASNPK